MIGTSPPLSWLFPGTTAKEFSANYYLRNPYSAADVFRSRLSLGSWETVERLIANPAADVIVGRGGEATNERPKELTELRDVMGRGLTLGVRHAHDIDAELGAIAAEFETAFGGPVDVHLYCTPGGHAGFGWHYDAEEVFVLQTVGIKTWRLRKNTVNPWPLLETLPVNQKYEREISPIMECRLEPGDLLYVPSGFWHTTTSGEDSVSLSIGVRPTTAIDVFDSIRASLKNSMLWRQRLPFSGCINHIPELERRQLVRELFRSLADDLNLQLGQDGLVGRFVSRTTPPGRS
jgi:ribosomal protein L16 Arg81 hydroxylase